MALQVHQKIMDALGENTDPTQPLHVGSDVKRVDSLFGGVYAEDSGQGICRDVKKFLIHARFHHPLPKSPKALGAQVFGLVRLPRDVECVVPLEIE